MSMIKNFEAELKAFVIKVLEDLDLYHNTAPSPNAGGGQQPPGGKSGSTITPDAGGGQQPPGSGGGSGT